MVALRERLAPLVLVALVLQVACRAPRGGLVLCVGSDGHVAVESGGCADESGRSGGRCDELGYPVPCSDTPLGGARAACALRARAPDDLAAPSLLRPASLGRFASRHGARSPRGRAQRPEPRAPQPTLRL